jgi:hypothetical protein
MDELLLASRAPPREAASSTLKANFLLLKF